MRTGTLRSLKAVVMKQPKVSAAITLSEKAKSELARDSTVFISPLGPAGVRPLLGRGGRGRKRAAGTGRARDRRQGAGPAGSPPSRGETPPPARPGRFRQEMGGAGPTWRPRWGWGSCRRLCSPRIPSYRGLGVCRSAAFLHSYSKTCIGFRRRLVFSIDVFLLSLVL